MPPTVPGLGRGVETGKPELGLPVEPLRPQGQPPPALGSHGGTARRAPQVRKAAGSSPPWPQPHLPHQAIRIQANGGVFMNSIYTQLPVSAGTWPRAVGPLGVVCSQGLCRASWAPAGSLWPQAALESPTAGSHLQSGDVHGSISAAVGTCLVRSPRGASAIPLNPQVQGVPCSAPGGPAGRSPGKEPGPDHAHPAAGVTVFRPTSFFVLVETGLGLQLQVQLVPFLQVVIRLDPSYHGQMCGEARWAGGGALSSKLHAGVRGVWLEMGTGGQPLPTCSKTPAPAWVNGRLTCGLGVVWEVSKQAAPPSSSKPRTGLVPRACCRRLCTQCLGGAL